MSSSALSQQATIAQMSLSEKLAVAPKVISLLAKTIIALLTSSFRDRDTTPPTVKKHVAYTALRAFTGGFSPRQLQYLLGSSDETYAAFCKSQNLTPSSEILADGTRAHWIGPRNAKKVILHFHGGGYVLPAAPYIFTYLHALREALRLSLPESAVPSILILSYDLSPGAVFPRQLTQATALLSHVLTALFLPPSSIILSGDSAGGNLALALLSHLAHPHPAVPALALPPAAKFLGLVLVSPWTDFDTKLPCFRANARKDDLPERFLTNCSSSFLGTAHPHPRDADTNYTQAALAPAEWWAGIPVEEVLVTGGEDEVLLDGVITVARNLEEGLGGGVELVVVKDEAHEMPFLAALIKDSDFGESARRIQGWVKSKL